MTITTLKKYLRLKLSPKWVDRVVISRTPYGIDRFEIVAANMDHMHIEFTHKFSGDDAEMELLKLNVYQCKDIIELLTSWHDYAVNFSEEKL